MSGPPTHAPPDYECPFCAVVRGLGDPPLTVEDDVVDRTDATTAWISLRWWERNAGHVIVVPNEHVENLFALDRRLAAEIHDTTRRMAFALKEAYGCDGVSTRQHNEPGADQEVWHYHVHVFPRYAGDNLYGSPWRNATPEERRPFAERVRAALAATP